MHAALATPINVGWARLFAKYYDFVHRVILM